MATGLDTSAHNNDQRTNEHTPSTTCAWLSLRIGLTLRCVHTSKVRGRTSSERADKIAYCVYGVYDPSARSTLFRIEPEVLAILRVGVDGAHNRSIISVDAGVERSDKQAAIKLKSVSNEARTHGIRGKVTMNIRRVSNEGFCFSVASASATFWTRLTFVS